MQAIRATFLRLPFWISLSYFVLIVSLYLTADRAAMNMADLTHGLPYEQCIFLLILPLSFANGATSQRDAIFFPPTVHSFIHVQQIAAV